MTVAELIEKLQAQDPNLEVYISAYDGHGDCTWEPVDGLERIELNFGRQVLSPNVTGKFGPGVISALALKT